MRTYLTVDANEAVAHVAYQASEVIAIYPITPSSPMGEWADQWASEHRPNLWGTVPEIIEMQSEAGVAGAVHGALQTGALSTTFTASQGLLLMIPNMYKIAGELTPFVLHVAARTVATHALSIFGDHSDVMAARQTGFAMLAANSVQESMDMALVAHAATLESRVPFMHFFDGFRTSHEVQKIEAITPEAVRELISDELVQAHRGRSLSPENPFIRGTAQNPDVFFQAREACNTYYRACPTIVENTMAKLAKLTGRRYNLFDYYGAPDAERVVIMMGSGAECAEEVVDHLTAIGEKVGLLKVRLFRPFSITHMMAALPASVKVLGVLDRTKEPGATGEPLYQDVLTACCEAMADGSAPFSVMPKIVGGRYGLSSKDFTPAMAKAVYDQLKKSVPRNHFTIGIHDDVTHTSLSFDPSFSTEDPKVVRALFYGLGSDGTVGANKNSIKIIGEETDFHAQGYFVYDSKKSGSTTVSHLRFGPKPIRSTYLVYRANFVACHQFVFLDRIDMLKFAEPGAVFLLNSPHGKDEVWDHLPQLVQSQIISKKLRFYVIDAIKVAADAGLGGRINTIMQTCFFAISGVLPREEAIAQIKKAIKKTYGKRGEVVVQKNIDAVDATVDQLHEVKIPATVGSTIEMRRAVSKKAPEFVRNVTARIMIGEGDDLPVSALPIDGTFPCGTTKWEKRDITLQIPVWDSSVCIQCGKCVMICPHGVIRSKVYEPEALGDAPAAFKSATPSWPEYKQLRYTLQVAPEDCTGCTLCVEICPAKNKSQVGLKAINMADQLPIRDVERDNWDFFLTLPEFDREKVNTTRVKDVQLLEPLFEFSGACAGCGETPYIKLLTQLFGDRMLVANATGCSSIYGGNLPTTPYTCNADGRGPAWANSLFEDNAEFGLGMRVTVDKQIEYASEILKKLASNLGEGLVQDLLDADQSAEQGLRAQRGRVAELKHKLASIDLPESRELLSIADVLVKKSVWIFGGDGWAYDIGYGGLDHVIASGRNVNILVMDTEVYSNTGGQASKATPRGAVAKFAAGGKPSPKKDIAMLAMTYGNVYVARIALGSNDAQTVRTLLEAEAYPGPSLVIAYSHCIAHGYDLSKGPAQQKAAVQSGHWVLMRYNPLLAQEGKNPLQLDSKAPNLPLDKYIYNETRYKMLQHSKPEAAKELLELAERDVQSRWQFYSYLAGMPGTGGDGANTETAPANGGTNGGSK